MSGNAPGTPTSETPDIVEPTNDYLGFLCEKCGKTFPIIGPLDLTMLPRDKGMTIGRAGPMPALCPHCGHKADYTISQLIRFSR